MPVRPLLRRRRILAAKIETEPGVAVVLAAADAKFNVFDPAPSPTIDYEEREGQGGFSPIPGVPAARGATISFMTELSGGASLPPWATTFLPACGFVATGNVYKPVSAAPGTSGVQTLTIGLYEDGRFKRLRGCMGNAVFTLPSGRKASIQWTFTGIWDEPTDVALIAPDYPSIAPLRFAAANMILGGSGGWEPKVEQVTIDFGNQVILREDANDISGYCAACVTGRRIVGTMNPEASLVADKDTHGEWIGRDEQSLEIELGESGNRVAFAAPKFQFTNIGDGDRNGLQIDELQFAFNRSLDAGDDDFTIDFT